ncbi:MAG: DUF4340 domain-containing protein, partial [Planctomycetes bacterium]|nr:DUF4340 domain-containing protein [Planctomycetota bacterium]
MNFKTTIALVVLLVIGGAAVLFTRDSGPADDSNDSNNDLFGGTANEAKYVLDPQPEEDDLVRVVLERNNGQRLVFEREAKKDAATRAPDWKMVEPVNAPTESWRVGNLARTFAKVQHRGGFEPGKDGGLSAAEAGFEPVTATITLSTADGTEYKLELGKKAAMSDDSYVRIAGAATIYRATRDLVREVEKKTNEYRKKKLFAFTAADATQFVFEKDGASFDFSRKTGGDWVINSPYRARGASDEIKKLVQALASVNADEFIDDAPADVAQYGLDSPVMRCSVTTETRREIKIEEPLPSSQPAEPMFEIDKNTFTLEIGSFADVKEQKRFARLAGQPWVISVATSSIENLSPGPDIRDRSVTGLKKADLTEFTVTVAGESATLKRVAGRWVGQGDLTEVDAAAIDEVLNTVEDIRAIDWKDAPDDPAGLGLDNPRAELTLTTSGAVAPLKLIIGGTTASGRNAYVQIEGQPTVYVVNAEQADQLVVPPIALRSRSIFEPDGGTITRLDVKRDQMHYTLEHDGTAWQMSAPAGAAPDEVGVRELISNLMSLRASRVVGKGEFADFNLPAEPAVTVEFTLTPAAPPAPTTQTTQTSQPAPQPTQHVLKIGRKGGISFCKLDEKPYIFELDETVFQVMAGELIRRKLFDFIGEQITRIRIDNPSQPLDFELVDGAWTYKSDPTVKLVQNKLKDFASDLASMSVERYVVYADADLSELGFDDAPVTVSITHGDGQTSELLLLLNMPIGSPQPAAIAARKSVFLLRTGDGDKLTRPLDFYIKADKPPADQPTMPPGFPRGGENRPPGVFQDFLPYFPDHMRPTAFIGQAYVTESGAKVMVALKLSNEQLNQVMSTAAGLSDTVDMFLVGPDYLPRTDSILAEGGVHTAHYACLDDTRCAINIQPTRAVFELGQEACDVFDIAAGERVLMAYAPVDFMGVPWSILARIGVEEAFAASDAMKASGDTTFRQMKILSNLIALGALIALCAAAVAVSKPIVRPLCTTVGILKDMAQGEGDLSRRLEVASRDEVGEMAKWFNLFMDKVQGLYHSLEEEVRERKRAEEKAEELAAFPRENPNPILSCGPGGALRYANPAAEAMAENLGLGLAELMPEDHAELVLRCIEDGQDRETECSVKEKTLWWRYNPAPSSGEVHIYAHDITKRKDSERQIRQYSGELEKQIAEREDAEAETQRREQYYRSLIEYAPDVILTVDEDFNCTYVSPAFERNFGYAPDELLGRSNLRLYHEEDVEMIKATRAELMRAPDAHVVKLVRLKHKDGTWRTVESRATNHLRDGVVDGIIINMHDVTDQERAQTILKEYSETLEKNVAERTMELLAKSKDLERAIEDLKATQHQLILNEKMASLGAM